MKKFVTWITVLLMLLVPVACGESSDDVGAGGSSLSGGELQGNLQGSSSQSGAGDSQTNVQASPHQVTQEQWESILASAFDSYTCDASQIDGQIYKMRPADGLYYREFLSGDSEYYYVRKGDKVDYYFVNSYKTGMEADESWERHERNANGGFEFGSDWLDWLPGIYNLDEFRYSEDDRSYTFYNSSEYFEFYFENGKLIRMVYSDERGEREYSLFGTTEINLPEVE